MRPFLVVFLKELKDASRDRRAVLSLFLFPILAPLLIYFMFNKIIDLGEEALDVELNVAGTEYASDLMDYLRQNGIVIKPIQLNSSADGFSSEVKASIKTAIENRKYDFALVIPADFSQLVARSTTVNVELHYDSSRTGASVKLQRVQGLIDGWGRETAVLRLMLRGVDPAVTRPVNVGRIDVASDQARAQTLLNMIPMFVIMAAFMSGVGIAVDATAGERERKSLEPLLVNPVLRSQLIIGKWLAAALFSIMGLIMVMALNMFALSRIPLETLGISFYIGPREIAGILLVTIPLAMFATSLQIFIGIFAKSFKDAQVYIGLMSLLPMLPFLYNTLNDNARELWMSFVPMLGQNMLLADVVSGRTPAMPDFLLAGICLLGWSTLFIALASRLLKRESIIFS
ncbi:MAG: ABC transporter permease [Pseudomonadota bacterium]